ncbi:MAG TPA: RMD1 family protein, partial [Gammaproteobacteria bacterium]|nr:RMD1 family protein [Gammaproteobacteria bacterium]
MDVSTMDIISFAGKERVSARSLLVGERIDLRSMKGQPGIAAPHMPIITSAGEHGSAVLFRYGVVVFFNVSAVEEESFLRYLRDFIQEPYEYPESEDAVLGFSGQTSERVDKEGTIWLNEPQAERLQIVADILAKSVV